MSYQTIPVRLIGERLCLDFLNTADWSSDGQIAHEKLVVPDDLELWCQTINRHYKIDGHFTPLTRDQDSSSRTALFNRTLSDLKAHRAGLRRITLAAMAEEQAPPSDLASLNTLLSGSLSPQFLSSETGRLNWHSSLSMLHMVGLSAASVLTMDTDLSRIKMCPGNQCGWLFLDESKNRRRRWCSMELCGNRAKARRHYHKISSEPSPSD